MPTHLWDSTLAPRRTPCGEIAPGATGALRRERGYAWSSQKLSRLPNGSITAITRPHGFSSTQGRM